jgi:hypothetical protein
MPKLKRTISRDSVFRDVSTREEHELPKQGLPPEETRTHQTAVWLGEEEIEWLDNQVRTVQRGGWRGVTRSALIRALIKAASEQKVDLSGTTGEVEIAERFALLPR